MLVDMKYMALDVLETSWPIVVISSIMLILLRTSYLVFHHEKLVLHKELFRLCFIVYILCLFQVVTYQDVSWAGSNIIPFKEIFRYNITDYLFYRNVLGNMLLFLPIGFFIKRYIGAEKVWQTILLTLVISFSIETTQLVIGRVFDIDDIILNVLGGVLGHLIAIVVVKLTPKVPSFLKKEAVLNILSLILLGGLIWFIIP